MEDCSQRIAGEIDRTERHFLVGRDREIHWFKTWLENDAASWRILNLHGTGGVGKSYLLDEFRRIAEGRNALFLYMDSRSFPQNPAGFCSTLLQSLRLPPALFDHPQADPGVLVRQCEDELRKAAARGKVILALDTFEEIGELEHWLRNHFLILSGTNILTIISGRLPLQGAWLSSPAWRRLIYFLPLEDLPYEAVREYLNLAGIRQEKTIRHIWARTKGHPLTLSLSVSALPASGAGFPMRSDEDVLAHVARTWLREVPEAEIRELVEAVAVLRHFNQEMLSWVLERNVPTEQFRKLIGHSFIRRVGPGWVMHDLLRDAIAHDLRSRVPETYDKLWKRCALYCYTQIRKKLPRRSVTWESPEWFYYIGDRFIRSMFFRQTAPYRLETLLPSNWKEAEAYLENRRRNNRDIRIVPEEGDAEEYWIGKNEALLWMRHIRLRELYELDPTSVKLLRDAAGKIFGFAVIIPIHEGTFPYLRTRPPAAAFFSSLPEDEQQKLKTPKEQAAGYFIQGIDVDDYADPYMRQAAGQTFISYMLSAGLVVTTVPAIPFFHASFQSLGFRKTKDIVHYDYGDGKPTPYFVLDTRGEKLLAYLNRMIASFGLAPEKENEHPPALALLSRREKEIAELAMKGLTNQEIAGRLFLSEATVKKHLANIFRKLQIKNRMQLIHHFQHRQ